MKFYPNLSKKNLNKAFLNACEYGHFDIIKYLLTSPDINPHPYINANQGQPLSLACIYGDIKIIEYLLTSPELKEHANIHEFDDSALRMAGIRILWLIK